MVREEDAKVSAPTIHHVQVAMPPGREATARGFYAGLLRFAEVEKPEHLRGGGGVWFETGNLQLHLGVDADFRPARKAHVAYQVSRLLALRERLVASGYPVSEDEPLAGYDRCYTEDPFGNRVELLEPK